MATNESETPATATVERCFLVVDLVGFTALNDTHGDEIAATLAIALAQHARASLSPQVELVKLLGDGALVAASDISHGFAFLDRILGRLANEDFPLAVRVGVHHGTAVNFDNDYVGSSINLASRLSHEARPGEVIGTQPVAEFATAHGLAATFRGTRQLRHIGDPVEIYAIAIEALSAPSELDPVCHMRLTGDGPPSPSDGTTTPSGSAHTTAPNASPRPLPSTRSTSMSADPSPRERREPPSSHADQIDNPVAQIGASIETYDTMRWWTWLSLVGLAVAVVLALIGGFPFDMPMPTHSFGWVEPTCGLTRGSTAIARGDLGLAWRYNPASFAVIAFGLAGIVRAGVGAATGRWLRVSIRPRPAGWVLLAVIFAALWAYQQTNAAFIIESRA